MRLTVRLFAGAAEAVGATHLAVEVPPPPTARGLLEALAGVGGSLFLHCSVAVNRRLVAPGDTLPADAEVAVLPPVSGGSGRFRVGQAPITSEAILAEVSAPDLGGQVLFLGTVRGSTDAQATAYLEYEAYVPMALEVLAEIASRAERLWPGCRLALWHRTGRLQPGEAAVAVAAAAAHRGDAFAAARFCIERVKVELPVWKKDTPPAGKAVWVGHP